MDYEDAASERRRRLAWAQQQLDRKAAPATGLLGIEDSGQDLSGVETLRASLRPARSGQLYVGIDSGLATNPNSLLRDRGCR
jgi:hypothetical protein